MFEMVMMGLRLKQGMELVPVCGDFWDIFLDVYGRPRSKSS
jgi:hypothetical protein